jgi:hypothetical protein
MKEQRKNELKSANNCTGEFLKMRPPGSNLATWISMEVSFGVGRATKLHRKRALLYHTGTPKTWKNLSGIVPP